MTAFQLAALSPLFQKVESVLIPISLFMLTMIAEVSLGNWAFASQEQIIPDKGSCSASLSSADPGSTKLLDSVFSTPGPFLVPFPLSILHLFFTGVIIAHSLPTPLTPLG